MMMMMMMIRICSMSYGRSLQLSYECRENYDNTLRIALHRSHFDIS